MTKIAVGFDFDRTLGLDYSLERHAFGDLAEQFGVTPELLHLRLVVASAQDDQAYLGDQAVEDLGHVRRRDEAR